MLDRCFGIVGCSVDCLEMKVSRWDVELCIDMFCYGIIVDFGVED